MSTLAEFMKNPDYNKQSLVIDQEIDNITEKQVDDINEIRSNFGDKLIKLKISGRTENMIRLTSHINNEFEIFIEDIPSAHHESILESIKGRNGNVSYRLSDEIEKIATANPVVKDIVNDIRKEWEMREGDNNEHIIKKLNFYAYSLKKMKEQLDKELEKLDSTEDKLKNHEKLAELNKENYVAIRQKWHEKLNSEN